MGANLDFIASHVIGHVVDVDNAMIAAAFAGAAEEDCDVRTYGVSTTPNWVQFWSPTTNSPLGGSWRFELLGNSYPDNIPTPPDDITSPWWQFAVEKWPPKPAPQSGVIRRTDG